MAQFATVYHLGRVAYRPAWELQRQVQERLIAAKRASPAEPLPHVILVVEHPHVYTLGKSGAAGHLLANKETLSSLGATFVPVDRGGDITYHGPGQVVVYPILDLHRIRPDIHAYLRTLEAAVAVTCGKYGVVAGPSKRGTGVWVQDEGPERKVCAMGIRCSRWVTMHGLALNVNTDLSYFDHIVPCGIANGAVTSLSAELRRSVSEAEVTERLLGEIAARFNLSISQYRNDEASKRLAAFTGSSMPEGAHAEATA